jgi:hypothetical protein
MIILIIINFCCRYEGVEQGGLLDEYIFSFPLSLNPFVNYLHLEISVIFKEKKTQTRSLRTHYDMMP